MKVRFLFVVSALAGPLQMNAWAATPCESLINMKLTNARVTSANVVAAVGIRSLRYHGWSDPQVTPMNSVNYYNDVLKTVGKGAAGQSIALFMIPGMNHCAGGPGTGSFDKVKVLEDWFEKGITPKRIIASHSTNGVVDKTRPLCPYPHVAKYNGTGDTNDAANFTCK